MSGVFSSAPVTVAVAPDPLGAAPKVFKTGLGASWTAVSIPLDSQWAAGDTSSMTANVLKTIVTLTGAGVLNVLSATTANATSRTIRVVLTIDGTGVLDLTSAAIVSSGWGQVFVGSLGATGLLVQDRIPFATSLLIQVASSLTESSLINVMYKYRTS